MTYPVKPLGPGTWWPGIVPYVRKPARRRVAVSANFSGEGGLRGVRTNPEAEFSGEGALSAEVVVTSSQPKFVGHGTLSAEVHVGTANYEAEFGGKGTLSVTVTHTP